MSRLFFILVLLMPMTACGQQPPQTAPGQMPVVTLPKDGATPVKELPPQETCHIPQGLVGQKRNVLETMKFGNPIRIIEPGDAVTMDYAPTRVNVIIDAQGIITEVKCG